MHSCKVYRTYFKGLYATKKIDAHVCPGCRPLSLPLWNVTIAEIGASIDSAPAVMHCASATSSSSGMRSHPAKNTLSANEAPSTRSSRCIRLNCARPYGSATGSLRPEVSASPRGNVRSRRRACPTADLASGGEGWKAVIASVCEKAVPMSEPLPVLLSRSRNFGKDDLGTDFGKAARLPAGPPTSGPAFPLHVPFREGVRRHAGSRASPPTCRAIPRQEEEILHHADEGCPCASQRFYPADAWPGPVANAGPRGSGSNSPR